MKLQVPIMGVLLATGFSLMPGEALPMAVVTLAQTTVYTQLRSPLDSTDNYEAFGPLPFGLMSEQDISGSFGSSNYRLWGSGETALSPGFPRVGLVAAEGHIASEGNDLGFLFAAGGQVDFFFVVEEIRAPGIPPLTLPIYFDAKGEGTISSDLGASGGYKVQASVAVGGFPFSRFLITGLDNNSKSFDDSVTLSLRPEREYRGQLFAECVVVDDTAHSATGANADCVVSVDPEVGFDQAAFDALMGDDTYNLSEYYRIVLSPNIPTGSSVPEPATLALLGLVLAGLSFTRRRKLN
jgi:hypothetical protein